MPIDDMTEEEHQYWEDKAEAAKASEQPVDCADLETKISIWSMRPQPGTPQGEAWVQGCRQGYEWGKTPKRESGDYAQIRSLFGLTLSLLQKQGYANTTEWNGELFIEDVFPALGIGSFAELKRYAVGGDLHLPLPEHPDQWRRGSDE